MTEHHHAHPIVAPVSLALRRSIISGAGIQADELAVTLCCSADVVRSVRHALFRDRNDGQPVQAAAPPPSGSDLDHDALDRLMRSNRSQL